jgi:hypothetical protein
MKTLKQMAEEAGFDTGADRITLSGQGDEDQWASLDEYPCGVKLKHFAALVAERCAELASQAHSSYLAAHAIKHEFPMP